MVPVLDGGASVGPNSPATVMKADEFEFLKESVAQRAEALKAEFRSLTDFRRLCRIKPYESPI